MAENSAISWTDATFNPWIGCTKVSPECENCYAERDMDHRYGKAKWGPRGTRTVTADANWNKPLRWNRLAADGKLPDGTPNPDGHRPRVFCASLADVFEGPETMPAEFVETVRAAQLRLLNLVRQTPNLNWLLLTKRPANIAPQLAAAMRPKPAPTDGPDDLYDWLYDWTHGTPPANVWLGTSCGTRRHGVPRIDALRAVPATIRFLSAEPLLEDLGSLDLTGIHWVITGGESGPQARPSDPRWYRSLRDQCAAAGVAFHHKQNGEWSEPQEGQPRCEAVAMPATGPWAADGVTLYRLGVKRAGRLLDGVTHGAFPATEDGAPC